MNVEQELDRLSMEVGYYALSQSEKETLTIDDGMVMYVRDQGPRKGQNIIVTSKPDKVEKYARIKKLEQHS